MLQHFMVSGISKVGEMALISKTLNVDNFMVGSSECGGDEIVVQLGQKNSFAIAVGRSPGCVQ